MTKCKTPDKRKYRTKLDADIALVQLKFRAEVKHRKQGRKQYQADSESYRCPDCGNWHHRTASRRANTTQ